MNASDRPLGKLGISPASRDPDWRTVHCAEPVAERILKATGRDIWAELGAPRQGSGHRPPRSWREGAELYRRAGVRTLEQLVTKLLGAPVPPRQARRGDPVMVRGALGLCRGETAECMGGHVPMREASAAWRLQP